MLGDSIRRRRRPTKRRAGKAASAVRELNWRRWSLRLVAGVLLGFGLGYVVSMYFFFPSPEILGDVVEVPDLVGRSPDAAERELAELGLGLGESVDIPSATHEIGTIVAQSPLAGQRLPPGADVQLALSQGSPRAFVPDLVGLPAERATALARRAGFEVRTRDELSTGPPGRVLRVDPRPGTELVLPAEIAVVVSVELPRFDLDDLDLTPDPMPIPRLPRPDTTAVPSDPREPS